MVVLGAVAVAVPGMTEVALAAVFCLMFLVILSAHIKHFNGLFYAKKNEIKNKYNKAKAISAQLF